MQMFAWTQSPRCSSMCLFPWFCLIFEIIMSFYFSDECLFWSRWLWIQAEQPGTSSGIITLLRARMQRINGCVFVSSPYNKKIKVLLMKSNFNQYFNVLLSCKHCFELRRLFPATGVVYAAAVVPSVLPARHGHRWVRKRRREQRLRLWPYTVPAETFRLFRVGCFLHRSLAMPFLLLTQELLTIPPLASAR